VSIRGARQVISAPRMTRPYAGRHHCQLCQLWIRLACLAVSAIVSGQGLLLPCNTQRGGRDPGQVSWAPAALSFPPPGPVGSFCPVGALCPMDPCIRPVRVGCPLRLRPTGLRSAPFRVPSVSVGRRASGARGSLHCALPPLCPLPVAWSGFPRAVTAASASAGFRRASPVIRLSVRLACPVFGCPSLAAGSRLLLRVSGGFCRVSCAFRSPLLGGFPVAGGCPPLYVVSLPAVVLRGLVDAPERPVRCPFFPAGSLSSLEVFRPFCGHPRSFPGNAFYLGFTARCDFVPPLLQVAVPTIGSQESHFVRILFDLQGLREAWSRFREK
jgi:hypothetical protein